MEPELSTGDSVWFDERRAPRSGELVVVRLHPTRRAHIARTWGGSKDQETYGIKRLVQDGGEWFLEMTNSEPRRIPLSDNIVCGPVVFVLRYYGAVGKGFVNHIAQSLAETEVLRKKMGLPKTPEPIFYSKPLEVAVRKKLRYKSLLGHCHDVKFGPGAIPPAIGTGSLDDGAISVHVESHLAGPVNLSASGPIYVSNIHSFNPPPQEHSATLKVLATLTGHHGSINGTQRVRMSAVVGGVGQQSPQQPIINGSASNPQAITIQGQFDYIGGQPCTISVLWQTSGAAGNNASFSDITIGAEFSKK